MVEGTYEVYLRVEKIFFHEKINFICLNKRVNFFLLHRYECFEKKIDEKQRNNVSDIFTSEDMEYTSVVSQM